MKTAQRRGQPERRSARLSKTRRRLEFERPRDTQALRTYLASGFEEELVVVHHQGDTFATQGSNQRSTPGQSSPGREGGMEGTNSITSSSEGNDMPTTTRLKYSRFRGDGSQDVDDWFCKFEFTTLANQEENDAKAWIF